MRAPSPLLAAVELGDLEIVRMLLDGAAEPNLMFSSRRQYWSSSALRYGLSKSPVDLPIIKTLFDNSAKFPWDSKSRENAILELPRAARDNKELTYWALN